VVCDVKMRSSLASSGDFMLLQKKAWRGGGAYSTACTESTYKYEQLMKIELT